MNKIVLPDSYNYVGAFITFSCTLGCKYCINKFGSLKPTKPMSGSDWVKGLSRIETREDLPVTLCGGEPCDHPDFYSIVEGLNKSGQILDLLTNGTFNHRKFMYNIHWNVFNRQAKYASLRFSFHQNTNAVGLALKVSEMISNHYNCGIWGLAHPHMEKRNKEMADLCKWLGIDYREKEFLDENYQGYKYPDAMFGNKKGCFCKPSELLISPSGDIFRCHRDLYAGINSYANILDEEVKVLDDFKVCSKPSCSPCDTKIKTNRFQEFGHCSVEIKDLI